MKEFHIRRADGAPLPEWLVGSHVTLGIRAGDGSEFENHYSLIGAPGRAAIYRIAVQREAHGKGGSRCLHGEYSVGDAIEMTGPFNNFPLQATPASSRVVLVAGGIGVTPILSMSHAPRAQGIPFDLHYLARSNDRLVFLDELVAFADDR